MQRKGPTESYAFDAPSGTGVPAREMALVPWTTSKKQLLPHWYRKGFKKPMGALPRWMRASFSRDTKPAKVGVEALVPDRDKAQKSTEDCWVGEKYKSALWEDFSH